MEEIRKPRKNMQRHIDEAMICYTLIGAAWATDKGSWIGMG